MQRDGESDRVGGGELGGAGDRAGLTGEGAVNYFDLHIGDYEAATAHLSHVEDAIYSRLLRLYYRQEGPLPVAVEKTSRLIRSVEQVEIVKAILLEFFTLADDGWHHKRCDSVIAKYREKAGKASGSAKERWARVKGGCERTANALPTQCEGNANQEPVTSNQEPKKQRADAAGSRLPPDFTVPADWRAWARTERPDLNPDTEAAKFVDHWHSQPGAKGRKSNWQATWRNWIRGAFAPRSPPLSPQSKTLSAIHKLEGMKHGLAGNRASDRIPETPLLGFGSDPGD